MRRADVGIVGAGAFGTALAVRLAHAGRRVVVWTSDHALAATMATTRQNPRFPSAALPDGVDVVTSAQALATRCNFIVVATASTDLRARMLALGEYLDGAHVVVHALGALVDGATRVSDVMAACLPTLRLGALAGPALPAQLVEGSFASMVVASAFDAVIRDARELLNAPPALRIYGTHDVVGVELASIFAGIYAVGLGLADGLGIGAGARAVMLTRAVAEGSRLGQALGADPRTFSGLAGLGNLLVRTTSGDGHQPSPEYALGRALMRGEAGEALEVKRAAVHLLTVVEQRGLHAPLLSGVVAVLTGKASAEATARVVGESVAGEE